MYEREIIIHGGEITGFLYKLILVFLGGVHKFWRRGIKRT
jgi:hypothetical protein